MNSFGVVVFAVLALGVVIGFWLMRGPTPYDEIGGGGLDEVSPGPAAGAAPPSIADDEADLRALLARKRAERREREGLPPEEPLQTIPHGPPWAHMESELVEEARALVARRRKRLAREGKPDVDEHEELTRILGPPHR